MKRIKSILLLLILSFVGFMGVTSCYSPVKYTEKCNEQNDTTIVTKIAADTVNTISVPRGARMP